MIKKKIKAKFASFMDNEHNLEYKSYLAANLEAESGNSNDPNNFNTPRWKQKSSQSIIDEQEAILASMNMLGR